MISQIHIALILLIVCNIHETEQHKESCHRLITESHLRNLSDMIDSQMETSCKQTIIYVDRSELDTTECFLKAAYSPLLSLLHKIKFKDNSANFNKLERIKDLHLQLGICIDDYPDHQTCTKKFSLTPEKMLQMVHDYFSEAKHFLFKSGFTQDCSSAFKKCSDSQEKDKMESTDKHIKRPEPSDTRGMAVTYVTVASVLGILLAVGGLLFYLHKSRTLTRRQPQRNDNNVERPEEGRPLNRGEEHIELQIQEV
nr:PREDICTED: macrophage colony-stimulating factor 1 isoform X2 [Anolis carolinensis]|eukprot:XP_008107646.1 PREDICTED: macrophage colony-stimulating factor 1 isoform X2 [Anolis carolinensis]